MQTPTPGQPNGAHELASEIELHKTFVMGYMLAMTPLLDPSMPLLEYYVQRHGQSHVSPAVIRRKNGTIYSQESMKSWLSRAAASGGGGGLGLGPEILTMAMLAVMTRIGDQMDRGRLNLYDNNVPITQFVRHLRNASAHGNRWHFLNSEPRYEARCGQIALTASMHGSRAVWGGDGTLGPGEFFDVLDELIDYLRSLPNVTGYQHVAPPTVPPPPPPDPSEPYVSTADRAALYALLDVESPGWRDNYSADLSTLDAIALRHLIAGVRAYLDRVISVTEAGGFSVADMTADQAVHAFAQDTLRQLRPPDQAPS